MTILQNCRAGQASSPYMFLPMGDHSPANMFMRADEVAEIQPTFSLDTQVCLECGLIQVADQIPADFFGHDLYVPSGAATMHSHFGELASVLVKEANGGLIIDIGCNDGLLLAACNGLGGKTLGIDPAANIAELAAARGVEVHIAYLDDSVATEVVAKHGKAEVIVTTNTLNHIGELHDFIGAVSILLSDTGTFVIEVPWAADLITHNEFDTIYQDHVSEFSLRSLQALGRYFGLELVDVTKLPIHGGSMRVFLQRNAVARPVSAAVTAMLEAEAAGGMRDIATYDEFADRIEQVREDLHAKIAELRAQGLTIAGYAAPAKGNTLLNYFQIGAEHLDFLVDRNPLKHGLYSPGMKIPVLSTDAIAELKPDILLVLAWNFFDEIREQQHEFVARGGRFLVPLPTPVLTN